MLAVQPYSPVTRQQGESTMRFDCRGHAHQPCLGTREVCLRGRHQISLRHADDEYGSSRTSFAKTENFAAGYDSPWFEIDVDIGSSRVAGAILGLVKGYTKVLVIDIAFLLESKTTEELPERMLGSARYFRINLDELARRGSTASPCRRSVSISS